MNPTDQKHPEHSSYVTALTQCLYSCPVILTKAVVAPHMILRCRQIPLFSCHTIAETAAVAIFPPPQFWVILLELCQFCA